MPGKSLTLDEAVELTRCGDIWIFRGRTRADRMIQSFTNSPVNHVGMAVVLDDLPPLMWHAELGRSLPDIVVGQTPPRRPVARSARCVDPLDHPLRPAGLAAATGAAG